MIMDFVLSVNKVTNIVALYNHCECFRLLYKFYSLSLKEFEYPANCFSAYNQCLGFLFALLFTDLIDYTLYRRVCRILQRMYDNYMSYFRM